MGFRGIFGLVASYEIRVSNTTSSPLAFDTLSSDVKLVIPQQLQSESAFIVREMAPFAPARSPWIAKDGPLPAHGTETGWVSFVTPTNERRLVNDGDLWFFEPGDSTLRYIGDIRLRR